jgi:D-glycero-alpha-D-manno-heptose-7-phosphate kinase
LFIVRAPVRISFGGGGTDLASYYTRFGGMVVSAAITRYCYVMVNERSDGAIHISSADYHCWEMYPRGEVPSVVAPLALPKAALAWFMQQGLLRTGIDLFLASDVPPGTGLGSSSAMAVALVHALAAYTGQTLTPSSTAELACSLEIERLQMPIGKQDQYASAIGGLNIFEFREENVQIRPLALPADVVSSLSARLLLFATGQTHNSADILGRINRDKQSKTQEVLHRIKALASEMCTVLRSGDLDQFGYLLDIAWHEKKRLNGGISTQIIDQWYEAACQAGALGGKITGAGGGGFLLFYCPQERQSVLRSTLTQFGLQEMPFDFDFVGPQLSSSRWSSEPQTSLTLPSD